jgi:hypothetical protein
MITVSNAIPVESVPQWLSLGSKIHFSKWFSTGLGIEHYSTYGDANGTTYTLAH